MQTYNSLSIPILTEHVRIRFVAVVVFLFLLELLSIEESAASCNRGNIPYSVTINQVIAYYLKYKTLFMKSLLGTSCKKSHGASYNTNKSML